MRRLLIAPLILSVLLVGCGLSGDDKNSYKKEIEKNEKNYGTAVQNRLRKLLEEDEELQKQGVTLFSGNARFNELTREILSLSEKRKYSWRMNKCLKRYRKSKEKFATAMTNCKIEIGDIERPGKW